MTVTTYECFELLPDTEHGGEAWFLVRQIEEYDAERAAAVAGMWRAQDPANRRVERAS